VLFPYIPLTTPKEGKSLAGLSISAFKALLADQTIESSYRNSNKLYINNISLSAYIKKHGGKKERLRESIIDKIRNEQFKYVSLILKNDINNYMQHNYSVNQIKQWHKIYTEYTKNKDIKKELISIGFTEDMLSKNYGTKEIDVGFMHIKEYVDRDVFKYKYRCFFNTYLQTKIDYETNFNYFISYNVAKSIIKSCRAKFK